MSDASVLLLLPLLLLLSHLLLEATAVTIATAAVWTLSATTRQQQKMVQQQSLHSSCRPGLALMTHTPTEASLKVTACRLHMTWLKGGK
jgi:hypothetical protein